MVEDSSSSGSRTEGDVEDGATGGGARTKNLAEKIAMRSILKSAAVTKRSSRPSSKRTGEDQISLTVSVTAAPWPRIRRFGVGYSLFKWRSTAKNKLIVEQAVTNQVVDMAPVRIGNFSEPVLAGNPGWVETIDLVTAAR